MYFDKVRVLAFLRKVVLLQMTRSNKDYVKCVTIDQTTICFICFNFNQGKSVKNMTLKIEIYS